MTTTAPYHNIPFSGTGAGWRPPPVSTTYDTSDINPRAQRPGEGWREWQDRLMAQDLATLHQPLALRPIPIEKGQSTGFIIYDLITDEKTLLEESDLPVFRNYDHALQHLTKGVRAPAGCTRVLTFKDCPYTQVQSRNWRFRNEIIDKLKCPDVLRYKCPLVLDLPIINACHPSLFDTIKNFKTLPVLSDTIAEEIVRKVPGLKLGTRTFAGGLPSLILERLTKDGKPRRSPAAAINKRRDEWLHARLFLHPDDYHRPFLKTFETLLRIQHGAPHQHGLSNTPLPSHHRSSTFTVNASPAIPYLSAQEISDNRTWKSIIEATEAHTHDVSRYINQLLTWTPSDSHYGFPCDDEGPFRTTIIYLRKRHKDEVLNALRAYYPLFQRIDEIPTEGDMRMSTLELQHLRRTWCELRTNLFKLARAMGCTQYPRPLPPPNDPSNDDPNDPPTMSPPFPVTYDTATVTASSPTPDTSTVPQESLP